VRPILLVAWLLALTPAGQAADAARGRQLFETHCIACHSTELYKRPEPKVRDRPQLEQEVRRWQAQIGQRWSQPEIDDVAAYLNERFYHFPRATPASFER
jgi:mono/diheme cytochrome c family protein